MDGTRHEGELDPSHVYQCSMCGGLVKFIPFPFLDQSKKAGTEMVRHTGTFYPLCDEAYVERLWP